MFGLQGVRLLDIDALVAPSLVGLIARGNFLWEGLVERLLEQDHFSQPPDKRWCAVHQEHFSFSIMELAGYLDSNLKEIVACAVHRRPLDLRSMCDIVSVCQFLVHPQRWLAIQLSQRFAHLAIRPL